LRRAFRTRTEGKVHSIQRENQPFSASLLRSSITKPLFSGERATPPRGGGWEKREGRGPGDGARSGPAPDGARRRPPAGRYGAKGPERGRSRLGPPHNAVIAKKSTWFLIFVQSPLHWTSAPSLIPTDQTATVVGGAARTAFSAGDRKPWISRKMGRPKRAEHTQRSPRS
jgi:hypothetical protein